MTRAIARGLTLALSLKPLCRIAAVAISSGGLLALAHAQVPTTYPDPSNTRVDSFPPPLEGREWTKAPPEGAFLDDATDEVAEADFYEVVASKREMAIMRDLKDRSLVRLTPDSARRFTG